jgi:glycosyltransferase involved in cell wall biosynthesis
VPDNLITNVSNMVDINRFVNFREAKILRDTDTKFTIGYVGSIGHHRGLDLAIRGLPEILDIVSEAQMVIVGGGQHWIEKLKSIAHELGVSNDVIFTGRVKSDYVASIMTEFDVGIVPHIPSVHTDVAVPNKLTEYMSVGTPVVVTKRPSLRRIIEDCGGGLVVDDEASSFANGVTNLATNQELRNQCATDGQEAVKNYLNWSTEAQKLLKLYNSL